MEFNIGQSSVGLCMPRFDLFQFIGILVNFYKQYVECSRDKQSAERRLKQKER